MYGARPRQSGDSSEHRRTTDVRPRPPHRTDPPVVPMIGANYAFYGSPNLALAMSAVFLNNCESLAQWARDELDVNAAAPNEGDEFKI